MNCMVLVGPTLWELHTSFLFTWLQCFSDLLSGTGVRGKHNHGIPLSLSFIMALISQVMRTSIWVLAVAKCIHPSYSGTRNIARWWACRPTGPICEVDLGQDSICYLASICFHSNWEAIKVLEVPWYQCQLDPISHSPWKDWVLLFYQCRVALVNGNTFPWKVMGETLAFLLKRT